MVVGAEARATANRAAHRVARGAAAEWLVERLAHSRPATEPAKRRPARARVTPGLRLDSTLEGRDGPVPRGRRGGDPPGGAAEPPG